MRYYHDSFINQLFFSWVNDRLCFDRPFAPRMQEIRDFFRYRIGYWNMLIPIGIIIVTNTAAYSMLNIAGLALLVPFDLIFIGATIADYLRDRKFNSGKHKQND